MAKNQFTILQSRKLCPFNTNEWEELKKKQNCPDPEFYHCIPDQYNRPGQICVKPNWASKNYCPIFNTAANDIDLIPCDLQYGACSDKDYRSNEVYQYAGCLNNTHQKIRGITTESVDTESPVQLQIFIPAVVLPVALLLVIILGVAIYCRRRKGAKNGAHDIELQSLLHQNEVPWSFLKAINYLENKVFYLTKSYEYAFGNLDTYGHTTLIGPPGSGKTFMAVKLARQKYGKEGKSPRMFFCKTLQEITTLPELKDAFMHVILDNWLDHYVYYPSKVKEDKILFDHIFEDFIKCKRARIIFTVHEDRWCAYGEHLSSHKLFCLKSCVSINKESFNKNVMQHMVKNHMKYKFKDSSISTTESSEEKTLANEEMDALNKTIKHALEKDLKSDNQFSLPVMIDLISANQSLVLSKTIFVKDKFSKIWRAFLSNWLTDKSRDEKNAFCIFMFAALLGGKITLADFTSKIVRPVYENVCKEYESECLEDMESIEVLLRQNQRLKGCLYQENGIFVFLHDSVLCFALQFLIETKNANFLIKNADIEILLKRCWIKDGILKLYDKSIKDIIPRNPVGTVILPIDTLKDLATRIYEEMVKGYIISDWPKHVFMEHETFPNTWEKVQKEKKKETMQNTERDGDANAYENGSNPDESEINGRQGKKDEVKASNSKKPIFKGETGQRDGETIKENIVSSDPSERESPKSYPNPEGRALNSGQSKQKAKKNEGNVSFVKTTSKSRKQEGETKERSVETSQQDNISSYLPEGETSV